MSGVHFEYVCGGCGVQIRAETWDPHELPRLHCPECEGEMDAEKGWSAEYSDNSFTEGSDA